MSEKTKITVQDVMASAFQALLRGDTAERDVLCAMVEKEFAETGAEFLTTDHEISFSPKTRAG